MSNLTLDTSFKGCVPMVGDLQEYFGKNTPFGRSNEMTGTFQLVSFSFYEHYPVTDKQDEIHNAMMLPVGGGISLPIDYVYKDIIDNCRTYSFAPSFWGEIVEAVSGDCTDPNNNGIIVVKDCGVGTLACA